jgi:PEP-CTERM/exosortase A-associated glycosyltransferase
MTRALETWALRRVDAVTTICEGLRRDMMARGLDADRITVIPNAVNVEDFSSGRPDPDLRSSLGLEGRTIIGYIGSFYAYEGLDLLVEALPAILAGAPDARLLLVGGGPEDAALRERVAALGLADKVVFTGRVPHAQVQKYYDLVDLLAYPRKSMRLTDLVTPLKPLEAMAMRKLLIASDVGGHRELIEHGRTGILFRAGDAADLARNTLSLLADRRRWGSILDEGRRYVAEVRNWPASVARYRGIYDSLAHGGQRG